MWMFGSRGGGSELWMPILDAALMQSKHLQQLMVCTGWTDDQDFARFTLPSGW